MTQLITVMLAAGQSQRFDGIKLAQCLPVTSSDTPSETSGTVSSLGESPLLARSVSTVLAGADSVYRTLEGCREGNADKASASMTVVLGAHYDVLLPILPAGVTVLDNPDWLSGLSTSLVLAAKHAKQLNASALCITLGDQVALTANDYAALFSTWRETGQRCAARYQGQLGVPAIVLAEDFDELMRLTGDRGAKTLLTSLWQQGRLIAIDMPHAATDIDTRADLASWLANKE